MASDRNKVVGFAARNNDYEALVLDFLDQQIVDSEKLENEAPQDELDFMVKNFIEKATAFTADTPPLDGTQAEETEAPAAAATLDEADFSTQPTFTGAEPDSPAVAPLRETSVPVDASTLLQMVKEYPGLDETRTEPTEAPIQREEKAEESIAESLPSGLRPERTIAANKPAPAGVGTMPKTDRVLTSAVVSSQRSSGGRMLVVGGVFTCLAAAIGFGAYYFGIRPAAAPLENKAVSTQASATAPSTGVNAIPSSTPIPEEPPKAEPPKAAPPPPAGVTTNSTSAKQPDAGSHPRTPARSASEERQAAVTPQATNPAAPTPPSVAPAAPTIPASAKVEPPIDSVAKTSPPPAPANGQPAGPPAAPAPSKPVETPASVAANPAPTTATPELPTAPAPSSSTSNLAARPAPKAVTPSMPVQRILPVYPEIARKMRAQGTVELEAQIDENGKVTKAKALTGPTVLRSAAEDAVMRWKFKPATIEGKNVASSAKVSIVFNYQK